MRLSVPSSRGYFQGRLSLFDAIWALVSPLAALYLSDALFRTADVNVRPIMLFCSVSWAGSLAAFLSFRIRQGLIQYFSVTDVLSVIKAVVVGGLLSGAILFSITRLEGVPRSALIVHAIVLATGLMSWRFLVRMMHPENRPAHDMKHVVVERILMVGATNLAARYIQLLDALSSNRRHVVALLDNRPERIGRSIAGVRVAGPTHQIEATINEYSVHGIRIDRVIVGGEADLLSNEALSEVRRVCEEHQIPLEFVPDLIGLRSLAIGEAAAPLPDVTPLPVLPRYFHRKRLFDVALALTIIVLGLPLFLVVGGIALLDVGIPIFFWQQRLGRFGRPFLLYKVRTLRAPFDWRGAPIPEDKRLSAIGGLLRNLRLDEFPQLLNVIVGDMALVGPRPLLPEDQPENVAIRLMVRPGITGWAQVNGGVLLTPEEKKALDEWYVSRASFWLDLRIVLRTIRILFSGKAGAKTSFAVAQNSSQAPKAGDGEQPPIGPLEQPAA